MRVRSILLAVLIVSLGMLLAWQFRRAPVESPQATPIVSSSPAPLAQPKRTKAIIPLAIGNEELPAGQGNPQAEALPHTVHRPDFDAAIRVPEIRSARRIPVVAESPRLKTDYHRPLAILGIRPVTPTTPPQQPEQQSPPALPVETTEPASPFRAESSGNPAPVAPRVVRHTIVDGDTLASLAETHLGDAARASEIFTTNRDLIEDANLLPIGLQIEIVVGD